MDMFTYNSSKTPIMKPIISFVLIYLVPTFLDAQIHTSTVEGYLEVYHPQDTSSMYIGKLAGKTVDVPSLRSNTIVGNRAGKGITTGEANSFFGNAAGFSNSIGIANSFFGNAAGFTNGTGNGNSFFGWGAGSNLTGSSNVCIGVNAGPTFGNGNLNSRLYIDNQVSNSPLIYGEFDNDIVQINGELVMGNTNHFADGDDGLIRSSSAPGSDLFLVANDAVIIEIGDRAFQDGSFEIWNQTNADVLLDLNEIGELGIKTLASGGNVDLYWNTMTGKLSTSSSSLRYKSDITSYKSGLKILSALRPVTFRWREFGEEDLGLIAEEVAQVEPLLVTYNTNGQVEGVKYDQISVVIINALKEQETQIKHLKSENKARQELIEDLRQRLARLEELILSSSSITEEE